MARMRRQGSIADGNGKGCNYFGEEFDSFL
jgi:hypothetical protein